MTLSEKIERDAKRKARRQTAALRAAEEREALMKFRVPDEVVKRNEVYVKRVGRKLKDSMPNLRADYEPAHRMVSQHTQMLRVSGFISPTKNMQKSHDDIVGALMVMGEQIRPRKGMMVQLTFVPAETVLMEYGRESPILTTSWMMTSEDEIGGLVSKGRSLFDAAVRNKWDITSFKLGFLYDRRVALTKEE